jgi:hypothetical protein
VRNASPFVALPPWSIRIPGPIEIRVLFERVDLSATVEGLYAQHERRLLKKWGVTVEQLGTRARIALLDVQAVGGGQ